MQIAKRITLDTMRAMLTAPRGVKPAIVEVKDNPFLASNPAANKAYQAILRALKEQSYSSNDQLNYQAELSDEAKAFLKSIKHLLTTPPHLSYLSWATR